MNYKAKSPAMSLFGINADVLFEITVAGELPLIPTLCRLNRATYETLKLYESKICARFLRDCGIDSIESLDPILTLDFDPADDLESENGCASNRSSTRNCTRPTELTFKFIQKILTRRYYAQRLAKHLVTTTWGIHSSLIRNDNNARVAEQLFAETVERGLYVHAHMADIAWAIEQERTLFRERPLLLWLGAFSVVLGQCIRRDSEWNFSRPPIGLGHQNWSFGRRMRHVREIMVRVCLVEAPLGRRRYLFRERYLDAEREIDFHVTKTVMCNLLQNIRHGRLERNVPGCEVFHRRMSWAVEEWFFLRQSLPSLAEIFMHDHVKEERECGLGYLVGLHPAPHNSNNGGEMECSRAANLLKELHAGYARNLKDQDCACWVWSRVWSLQPTMYLNDGDRYEDISNRRRGDRFRLWASNDPDAAKNFELFTGEQQAEEASAGEETPADEDSESEPHLLSFFRTIFTRAVSFKRH